MYEKTIDDYLDPYLEAYNTSLNIDWNYVNNILIGDFEVQDLKYKIYSEVIINNFMTFKFKVEKDNKYSSKLLNSDKPYKISVIPTIKTAIEFVLNTISPNGLIFGALDDSKGRKMIYRFCKDYVSKSKDYVLFEKLFDNKKIYVLHKNIEPEILFNTIKYCGDNFIDII